MVMQARSASQRGVVYTNAYTKGVITKSTVSTDIASDMSLTCGRSSKGNFKGPNNWNWSYRRSTRNTGTSRSLDSKGSGTEVIGPQNTGSIPFLPDMPTASVYNAALGKLAEQVRGGLDLSVDAFQIKQNARMMNVLDRLRNFYTGRGFTALSLMRGVGSKWLEFQYGWKPIAEDIYGIAEESLRYAANHERTFKVRTRDRDHRKRVSSGNMLPKITNTEEWEFEVKCEICVTLNTQPGFDLQRYTSLNPVSIAWELLPYSFVIDWLCDVGGYLRCAETGLLNGNRFKNGYVTFLRRKTCDYSEFGSGPDGYGGTGYRSITAHHIWASMNRSVLSTYPMPRLPRIDVRLGSQRLLNAAAMLSQFLRR